MTKIQRQHLKQGSKMKWLKPVELKGKYVTLELLTLAHIEELKVAVLDGESWKLWYANVPSPDKMEAYVEKAIANKVMWLLQ